MFLRSIICDLKNFVGIPYFVTFFCHIGAKSLSSSKWWGNKIHSFHLENAAWISLIFGDNSRMKHELNNHFKENCSMCYDYHFLFKYLPKNTLV